MRYHLWPKNMLRKRKRSTDIYQVYAVDADLFSFIACMKKINGSFEIETFLPSLIHSIQLWHKSMAITRVNIRMACLILTIDQKALSAHTYKKMERKLS